MKLDLEIVSKSIFHSVTTAIGHLHYDVIHAKPAGLLTGYGKKMQLCGIWGANCVAKYVDRVGIVQDYAIL